MKMMMKKVLFALFSSSIFFGCGNQGKRNVEIPAVKPLYADSIEVPPELLSVTSLFMVGDDTLGVYQQQDDTLFSFWKLPEFKFMFKAGTRGQGPNDFLDLDKTFQGKSGGFNAFEIDAGRVKRVTIEGHNLLAEQVQRLDVDQRMNRFIFLADDTYCFFLLEGNTEFALYNERNGLKHFGQYPDLITKKPHELDVFAYNKLTIAHPAGDKFAAFYAYLKMCRIYGADGSLQKEVLLEGPVELDNGSRKIYYSTPPYATAEHIYILAHNTDEAILEVWNWEAEMVERFSLDKKINRIIVYDHYLYGFSNVNESVVYVYKLE